jgi:hypothetical protein
MTLVVGKDTWNVAGVHNGLHRHSIPLAFLGIEFLSCQPPPHTPTTTSSTVLAEEFLEVSPSLWRQRM